MHIISDEDTKLCSDTQTAHAADRFAAKMDDVLLNLEDMNLEACPPDKRYFLGEQEAWVYEHGNICELVFVRV